MSSGKKTDTVKLLTTEMAARFQAQEDALVNGTVSEEAIDNFDQAREKEYLDNSYNTFIAVTTNTASKDDSLVGTQQANSFLSGNQRAYLQRRRSKLTKRLERETINSQNISISSGADKTPYGVITAQLATVGDIVDPLYLTELLQVGQESS